MNTPVEPEEPEDIQQDQPDPVDHPGGEPEFPSWRGKAREA